MFRWVQIAGSLYTARAIRNGATVDVYALIDDPENTILFEAGRQDDPIADGKFSGTVAELHELDDRLLLDAGYLPA